MLARARERGGGDAAPAGCMLLSMATYALGVVSAAGRRKGIGFEVRTAALDLGGKCAERGLGARMILRVRTT
jgi:hypothetical protein